MKANSLFYYLLLFYLLFPVLGISAQENDHQLWYMKAAQKMD